MGKDEKRRKKPVPIPPPKVPAPKRMPSGAQPLQPKYEKSEKPEGMAGEAPSKVELPPPKPGKAPDRSLSGHWVELGEPAQKKEEQTKEEKPKVDVKRNLLVGTISGLIAAGVLAAVFYHMGFFSLGGGAAQTWSVYSDSGGQYATLTVDSSGNFTGSGWQGYAAGIGYYDINITNGRMSGTSITFNVSATYGAGSISGTYSGTLNASFPNATSASGTATGTISDPLGTRALSDTWSATRVS